MTSCKATEVDSLSLWEGQPSKIHAQGEDQKHNMRRAHARRPKCDSKQALAVPYKSQLSVLSRCTLGEAERSNHLLIGFQMYSGHMVSYDLGMAV